MAEKLCEMTPSRDMLEHETLLTNAQGKETCGITRLGKMRIINLLDYLNIPAGTTNIADISAKDLPCLNDVRNGIASYEGNCLLYITKSTGKLALYNYSSTAAYRGSGELVYFTD